MAGLRGGRHPAEQVVAVGDVGLGPRQVLGRQPPERVVAERDRLAGAVAKRGDVAAGVVAIVFVIRGVAGAGALGRVREQRPAEPVVAVMDVGRPVVLGIGDRLDEAVRRVAGGDFVGLVGGAVGALHLRHLPGRVVDRPDDPVGAEAALGAEAAGAGREAGEEGAVHPLRRAFGPPQRVVAGLGEGVDGAARDQLLFRRRGMAIIVRLHFLDARERRPVGVGLAVHMALLDPGREAVGVAVAHRAALEAAGAVRMGN